MKLLTKTALVDEITGIFCTGVSYESRKALLLELLKIRDCIMFVVGGCVVVLLWGLFRWLLFV